MCRAPLRRAATKEENRHLTTKGVKDTIGSPAAAQRNPGSSRRNDLTAKNLARQSRNKKEKSRIHHEVIHDLTLAHRG